jgi:hypothetical protein
VGPRFAQLLAKPGIGNLEAARGWPPLFGIVGDGYGDVCAGTAGLATTWLNVRL